MRVWQMGRAMNQLLLKSFEKKRGAVVLLCEKHGVASLDLFGSGVSGAWNPNTSDLDFIVTFRTDAVGLLIDRYLGLADDLGLCSAHEWTSLLLERSETLTSGRR